MIGNPGYGPADSVSWSGACRQHYAEGQGTSRWYYNQQLTVAYTGNMHKGYPDGKGKYTVNNYGVLEGNFKDGLLQGQGKLVFTKGGKLEGNFEQGNFLNLDAPYLAQLKKIELPEIDTTGLYRAGDQPAQLSYYVLAPKSPARAVLVLFPSTWESMENVISSNRQLMQQCYDQHILAVVIGANFNKTLESDKAAFDFFNRAFTDIIQRYKAPKDKFILSGLSLGGSNALQYTEMSRNPAYTTSIKPVAVIGVDPAVDETDLYYNAKEAIARYQKDSSLITESIKPALAENNFLMDYFHSLYGGSPADVPERYLAGSVFSRTAEDGGNARFLVDVPVRLYSDPDILWNLKYKNRDYYHMNAANLSAMTNFLMMKGNKRAEFIPATGKGYRVDGTRHPHSWSIVDAGDCVQWILQLTR